MDYNQNGNILTKSDAGGIGGYSYLDTNTPYTLSKITNANTDLASQLDVNYTVMSRPVSISKPSGPSNLVISYQYNDDYDRSIMNLSYFSTVVLSKCYFGGGKYEIDNSGTMQRLYLDGSPYTASIVLEKDGDAAPKLYYLHRDYLGSVTQITDNIGNLAAEYSYDAWGRMRNVNTWQPYTQATLPTLKFGRGYTGHEQLNDFGLINMNARLYDPLLGRFLAPDPYVGSGLSNDFNRYVYARNNPLMYTDPSGKSVWSWLNNQWNNFSNFMNKTFPNGFEVGYSQGMSGSSSGGFFYKGNLNGGSSFGGNYNKGTFTTTSTYQGYTSSSYNPKQAVVQAEQSARSEYFEYKSMASDYQTQISNWFENHMIFESEFRIDYGAQIAGNVKAFGGKLGFDIEKNTSPILQANIDYNNGWKSAIYESGFMNKGEYSYGILDNVLRSEWSLNLFGGVDKTYYPTSDFFSWGDIQSKSYNLLLFSDTYLYDHYHNCYETQHTMDFGFNFALGLGINANIKFGYK